MYVFQSRTSRGLLCSCHVFSIFENKAQLSLFNQLIVQMQNATKRKRADSGSLQVPDGFVNSKPSSRPGKSAAPSFHSGFITTKKPAKQESSKISVHTNHQSALKTSPSTSHRTTHQQAFILDSQFPSAQIVEDSHRIVSTNASASARHNSGAIIPLVHTTTVKNSVARLSTRPVPAMNEVHSASNSNQPIQDVSESSSSIKPMPKFHVPSPRQDTAPIQISTKPLLKSLVTPRLTTPKSAIGQKVLPLPLPLIQLPTHTTPNKPLRTIATTRMARATDLSTESGAAELASIVLQNLSETLDTTELKSGLDLSPKKNHPFGRGPRFVRDGLAAHAASLLSHINTSVALWATECSTLSRLPMADLLLRVIRIIHRPLQETHTQSKIGLAICRLHDKQSFLDRDFHLGAATEFPVLDTDGDNLPSSTALVLFSFSSHSSPGSIRNAADFKEDAEFWVCKPWRTMTLSASQIQSLSALTVGLGQDVEPRAVEGTALFSDRFGRYDA
ncbi:hypothetical protein J3R30DRAFT_1704696 [Lentinula aciculospora]|uniref:Uncharacterized protein n=1 Tax=Lentinula aciculospora TaxID=153920 RepID=A0A9W8ZWH8_9AGAR|nr:hypothetical protein J3R30DRAFT_1704696 [Lentinula aciculospora]